MGLIVFMIVIALIVLYFVAIYNGLVTSRNGYENAFAQIGVQLTRRHDLIRAGFRPGRVGADRAPAAGLAGV